jgi:hypothetical protein
MSAQKSMAQLSDDALGKLAWDTYSKAVGGKAFNGDALPTWEVMKKDETKAHLVKAWKTTANAVAERVISSIPKVANAVVAQVKADAGNKGGAFPPSIRKLPKRTRCCGAINLTLKTNKYRCPCGGTVEPL